MSVCVVVGVGEDAAKAQVSACFHREGCPEGPSCHFEEMVAKGTELVLS